MRLKFFKDPLLLNQFFKYSRINTLCVRSVMIKGVDEFSMENKPHPVLAWRQLQDREVKSISQRIQKVQDRFEKDWRFGSTHTNCWGGTWYSGERINFTSILIQFPSQIWNENFQSNRPHLQNHKRELVCRFGDSKCLN